MLRYKTETRPGLVALYNIRPGNGAGPFLQPRSPHGACIIEITQSLHGRQCIMTEQKLYAFHAQDKLSNPTTAEMKNRDPKGPLLLTNCDQRDLKGKRCHSLHVSSLTSVRQMATTKTTHCVAVFQDNVGELVPETISIMHFN